MDKNLKAELSALRNDVTTGLSGLQTLVQNIDAKLKQLDQPPEPSSSITIEMAKEWEDPTARPIDDKTIMEMFKEASHWDEMAHEIFVTMWNKTRKRRIESLDLILTTLASDASKHMPDPIRVRDMAEAEAALREMTRFTAARDKIVSIISSKDRSKMEEILASDAEDNFVAYYWWLNEMVDEILSLREDPKRVPTEDENRNITSATEYLEKFSPERDPVNILVNNVVSLYRMLMEQHEMEMYDLVVIDPNTFTPKRPPEEKMLAYRRYCLANYNKDLMQAYEFVAKRNKSELDALVRKAIPA